MEAAIDVDALAAAGSALGARHHRRRPSWRRASPPRYPPAGARRPAAARLPTRPTAPRPPRSHRTRRLAAARRQDRTAEGRRSGHRRSDEPGHPRPPGAGPHGRQHAVAPEERLRHRHGRAAIAPPCSWSAARSGARSSTRAVAATSTRISLAARGSASAAGKTKAVQPPPSRKRSRQPTRRRHRRTERQAAGRGNADDQAAFDPVAITSTLPTATSARPAIAYGVQA